MSKWTQPYDVLTSWIGEGAPTDLAKIQTWIDRAEREVRYRVPDLELRIAAAATGDNPSDDLFETAKDVVAAMVTRVFRNPEGIRQTNVTTGPYTASKTYGGDTPGGLSLTEDELAKLQGSQVSSAYTVSMIPSTSPFSPDYKPWTFL
jgi:hypothetical protein